MKITTKDNWRVVALISPTKAPGFLALLGATEQLGTPVQGHLLRATDFEITIVPDGLNHVQLGEIVYPRENEGEKGCEVIRDALGRHPHVVTIRVDWDEEHRCSHCNGLWEELLNNGEVAEFGESDGRSVIGEPVCCTKAANEFRTERGIPLLECST